MKDSIDIANIFHVGWDIKNGAIQLDIRVGFGPINEHWTPSLTYQHPSVTLSTPSIAGHSAGVTVSIDNSIGRLAVEVKWCYPVVEHFLPHIKTQTASWSTHVLPTNGLAQISQGIMLDGVQFMEQHFPHVPIGYDLLSTFKRLASKEALQAIKDHPTLIEGILHQFEDAGQKPDGRLKWVTPQQLTEAFVAVIKDSRILGFFPFLPKVFPSVLGDKAAVATTKNTHVGSTSELKAEGVSGPSTGHMMLETIIDILEGVGALAALTTASIGGIALSILGILLSLAATAASGGSLSEITIPVLVVLCIFAYICVISIQLEASVVVVTTFCRGLTEWID